MEVKSLARARMCVHKSIAEPERAGSRDGRQGGLRGNSIAFPQARVEMRNSNEYPPSLDEAARFMSESVVIAMCGTNVEDLHNARWAEIRRQPYVNAAHMLTQHNMFHGDMEVNEERAAETFADSGRTSDAVLKQAVPIEVSEELRCRMEGPADTGEGGVQHEQAVELDGVVVEAETDDEHDHNAVVADNDHPEEAMPPMHVCADELTGGDLDELQALRRVHADLEKLQDQVRADAESDCKSGLSRRRVRALQQATKAMLHGDFADAVVRNGREIDMMETEGVKKVIAGGEGYAQGTASRPMSMYGPEQWGMCFPILFPYGDGVFGLPRRNRLTFQQCVTMHLLREELSYQVSQVTVLKYF